MQSATLRKFVSPARRVHDMRNAAVHTSVDPKPARSLYERLYRTTTRTRLRDATPPTQTRAPAKALATTSSRTSSVATHSKSRPLALLAHARVDYGQEFSRTRIPKPTITAVKKAYARRKMGILRMMGIGEEVHEMPRYKKADPAEESEESEVADIVSSFADKAEVGADNEYTDVFVPIYDPNEPWELEHSGLSQDEKTSLMFNDKSFDEDLDPDAQTPGFNVFERRIVSGKRVGMGLPVARVPRYIGGEFGIRRRRPLPPPKARDVHENQLHPYYSPAKALATCKLPYLVWPLATPTAPTEEAIVAKFLDSAASQTPSQTSRELESPSTSALERKVSKPTTSKPPREAAAHRLNSTRKPRLALQPIAAPNEKPVTIPEPRTRQPKTDKPVLKTAVRQPRKVKPVLKSTLRQPDSKIAPKHVQCTESPVKPRFYSRLDNVTQSAIAVNEQTAPFHWEPLNNLPCSQPASEGHGIANIFDDASEVEFTLNTRFLNRYASIQRYEKRRIDSMIMRRQHPGRGQLEYGNADFKIDLKASELIMAHEIGMRSELSAIGKKGRMPQVLGAEPVLVFGAFEEPFEPAVIPEKGVKAYKKPLAWPATQRRLEEFADKHLRCLQTADLED